MLLPVAVKRTHGTVNRALLGVLAAALLTQYAAASIEQVVQKGLRWCKG